MKKIRPIIFSILICLFIGFTASFFQSESINSWYPLLNKSPLTPPKLVFPITWTLLYFCMGVSAGLIIQTKNSKKKKTIILFTMQLVFNFMWSIFFFYFQNPLLGLANILILDVIVIAYAIKSYPLQKASSILFIPYILWILFATYLNAYIVYFN